jgi:hypothetical protein
MWSTISFFSFYLGCLPVAQDNHGSLVAADVSKYTLGFSMQASAFSSLILRN